MEKAKVTTWKIASDRYLHEVKVDRGYFHIVTDSSSFSLFTIIIRNKVLARRSMKEIKGLKRIKDYRDLTLHELARIIFLRAPINERQEREAEWEGLGSYYRKRLPKEISLNIFHYPNRFDIQFPSLDLTLDFWKRLPRRDHKRKPKNIVKWFDSAIDTGDHSNYLCIPLGTYSINLASLIWWLGDKWREVLLEEMFGNV